MNFVVIEVASSLKALLSRLSVEFLVLSQAQSRDLLSKPIILMPHSTHEKRRDDPELAIFTLS
jgi:hypothetical protein